MPELVGTSEAMKRVRTLIRRFAEMDATVFVVGESGTGKGTAARALHDLGPNPDGPFVRFHCAGWFSGGPEADAGGAAAPGVPEDGTLFLEEVADLSDVGQARLLAILAERDERRTDGGRRPGRIVCSARSNPAGAVRAGRFREDLHYRLNELTLPIPPLRERPEDIPLLADRFLESMAATTGRAARTLSREVAILFGKHRWPGNVRQLRNILEYAAAVCPGAVVFPEHLPEGFPADREEATPPIAQKSSEIGRLEMLEALRATRWHKTKAAELLGISRSTFYRKMGELGIG